MKRRIIIIFLILSILTIIFFVYLNIFKKDKKTLVIKNPKEEILYDSNIMLDVRYLSKDAKGNEYIITASQGEIDYSDPNTIFLTNVEALVKLVDSNNIKIISDYGKYSSDNFDTIL